MEPLQTIAAIILALPASPIFWGLGASAIFAGLIRGFSGFGSALAFMPGASALVTPAVALPVMNIIDTVPILPLLPRAIRNCEKREVALLVAGCVVTVPLGVWLLRVLDPIVMRWAIVTVILLLVAALAFNLRYRGKPSTALTFSTGLVSGIFGGMAGLSGPPVIIMWLAGQNNAERVRANTMVFLASLTVVTSTVLFLNGLFTLKAVAYGIALMPFYGLGLFLGARLFPLASERVFRRAAFALIALGAVLTMPVFDRLF